MRCILLMLAAFTLAGCAHSEYDLTEPETLSCHIGSAETRIPLDPVIYRMQTYDNRLVMMVDNPTSRPIHLVGDDCHIIDPNGVSHPLTNQTIDPQGSIKLIFPPFPDRTQGPTFIINLAPSTQPAQSPPVSSLDWADGQTVTMVLAYFYDDTEAEHDLVFRRRRM